MRITTSSILRTYQTGLAKNTAQLDEYRQQVLTQKKISKASEDPSAASRSFQLRKDFTSNDDYMENLDTAISHFDAVESSSMQMNDIAKTAGGLVLDGINGSTSLEARKTIASSLRKMQESLVLTANTKFGDDFLLGGENKKEMPFVLKDGKIEFYGLDVSDPANQTKLKEMSQEKILVDIGFGLKTETSGKFMDNSAFNLAFSGLNLLGYGADAKGNDSNIVNLMGQIADELDKDPMDTEKVSSLSLSFDNSKDNMVDFITELGTKSNFLDDTKTRLTENEFILNKKITDLENVNLAEAISSYSWSQFAYNAALKVGNSILSQSFIDFMR